MAKSHWLLTAGILALAAPAHAQQTAPATSAQSGAVDDQAAQESAQTGQGEIIVTATRRNEALSDVPLAVSAIAGDSLTNTGAADIRQLQQLSPSLLVTSTQSEAGASSARIRGVGTVGDNPGLESSVAVFIDGVYRSRNGTALTELGPVERVEVLRGPQGTLFGRNASAGLISVITARPRFQQEVRGELSYGNFDYIRAEAGITGPLTDTIAYRLDGVYLNRDGFITDVISGRTINNRDRYLLRGQMLFEPTDALSVRVIADYANRSEECCGATYLPFQDIVRTGTGITAQPSTFAGILRALGANINDATFGRRMSITPGRDYRQDVEDWGVSAEAVYDFGGATLTSITAYRANDLLRGQDADYNNLDILYRASDGGASQRFRTFTQELRLQGEALDGRLDWLVGGYFADEKLTVDDNLSYGADYQRYANCVLSATLSQQLSAAIGAPINLVNPGPTGRGCFNQQVAGALVANPGLPADQRQLLALLSGLAPGVPVGGFDAIGAALGAATATPGLTLAGRTTQDRYQQDSRNFAIFTHNIFEIARDFNFTIGLRYTNERKRLDATFTDNNNLCRLIAASQFAALSQLACVLPAVPGGNFTPARSTNSEDALSGTAVLSYKPTPSLLTYASYSRGYKSGGFNLDRSALPRTTGGIGPVAGTATLDSLIFEPEEVDAFEIGAKYNGPGFDLNVAAFRQVFDNFQLNTFNGLFFEVENINACADDLGGADTDANPATGACTGKLKGGVRSQGVEIEAFMRPMQFVSLNLGATIVDTQYRRNLVGMDGAALSPVLFQLPGRRMSNSAMYSLTGSFAYTPPLGDDGTTALLYFDGRYQSRLNTGSDLDVEKIQDGYFVANARIGIRGPGERWAVELWGQNIFDKDYLQIGFDSPLQGSGSTRGVEQGQIARSTALYSAFLSEPRTYGITGRFRF